MIPQRGHGEILALLKRPREAIEWVSIKNELECFRNLVCSDFGCYMQFKDVIVLYDECGERKGLPYNVTICGKRFYGNILLTGSTYEKDFGSMRAKNEIELREYFPQLYRKVK